MSCPAQFTPPYPPIFSKAAPFPRALSRTEDTQTDEDVTAQWQTSFIFFKEKGHD